jgi:AraC-like DNA-binding protein
MRTTHFNPTKRQIRAVQEMVEKGWTRERMRQRIVDPGNGKILTTKAFNEAFGYLMEVDYSRGKESFEPTDKQRRIVQLSKLCGFTDEDICDLLDVSLGTLTKHFSRELKIGRNKLLVQVTDNLVRQALHHNDFKSQALILKAQGRWIESKTDEPPKRATDAGVLIVPADVQDPKQWEKITQAHMQKVFADEQRK